MQEGFVVDQTYANSSVEAWVAGAPEKGTFGIPDVVEKEQHRIHTLRCRSCGLLEHYANRQ